jgi:hypothetical protein
MVNDLVGREWVAPVPRAVAGGQLGVLSWRGVTESTLVILFVGH